MSLAASLVALSALISCHAKSEGDSGDSAKAVVTASTVLVAARTFTETVAAIGDVEPRTGFVAALSAPAPTRVATVYVAAGQHVTKGEKLVELEQAVFEASAKSAQAAVDAAQKNFDRQQRLLEAGVAARKEVDQASSDLAQAKSNLVAALRSEELSIMRSPIDGVVTRMNAVLGASVDVNQVLVEVADPTQVDVVLQVTPAEAARVRVGAGVLLRSGQGAVGDTLGRAEVRDVGGVVDSTTRTVSVRARASDTHRPLRIGETVSGDIVVATHRSAIVVPNDALVPEGESFKVFVVDSANTAHEREVTIGGRNDGVVEILKGLAAGERVVTYGAYGLSDGAKVVPAKP